MSYQSNAYDKARALNLQVLRTERTHQETYAVESQTQDTAHTVDLVVLDGEPMWTCDCAGYEYRGFCVHIASADLVRRGLR